MSAAELIQPDETYTLTFDSDPAAHAAVARATGIESKWFASWDELVRVADRRDLDPIAVFVDVRLGVEGGEKGQLITRLKAAWPTAPIILTGGDEAQELLVDGMALGADDFVESPFDALDHRRSLIRRFTIRRTALSKRAARESIMFGDMTIDTLQRSVSSPRGQKFLSPTEIKLIAELAKAGGNVVPRATLKTRCWPEPAAEVSDNALNRKLYEIRRRLKPITNCINIRTIYGVGFIMEQK